MISVAIDGPAGAGKSTISRRVAKTLGFIYVDTGALYRAVALAALTRGAEDLDSGRVEALLNDIAIELKYVENEQHVFLNGEDVSAAIRTPAVSMAASAVSALPCVRAFLFDLQREMAKRYDVVMDGRDIGTVVLPHADVKIFLTASPEDRARRRYEEMLEKGQKASFEDVLSDIVKRDYNDSHRDIAPLKPAEDSVVLDTSGNTLEQSVALLTRVVRENLEKSSGGSTVETK